MAIWGTAIMAGVTLGGMVTAAINRPRRGGGGAEPRDTRTTEESSEWADLSPEQAAAAQALAGGSHFRLGSAAQALEAAGGWPALMRPDPSPFRLTQEAETVRQGILQRNPDPFQSNAAFSTLAGAAGRVWDYATSPLSVGSANYGAASVDFAPRTYEYTPVDVDRQPEVATRLIDPEVATAAARDLMASVVTPSVTAQLTASGLGRSGALAEALSQRGTELALPIARQILAHESAAAQLDAQIAARQREVELLETQKARLQAQALTAESQRLAESLGAQIASVEAQIRGRLAEAELMGQVQAAIAQRTSALQFAGAQLGQWLNATMRAEEMIDARQARQLEAAQLPHTLAQQDLIRQQQALLGLTGMTPSGFPPLGHRTHQTAFTETDVEPFQVPPVPPSQAETPPPEYLPIDRDRHDYLGR